MIRTTDTGTRPPRHAPVRDVVVAQQNFAFVARDLAHDLVHQRGFARAVGTDHSMNFTDRDVDIHMVGYQQAAVALDQTPN